MTRLNVIVTSKPGDGLMHYSFEQVQYLNDLGINANLIIIPHYKFKKETYIEN